jgi:sugar transferase EpsL
MIRSTMPPLSRIASARSAPAPEDDPSIRGDFAPSLLQLGHHKQLRQLSVAKRLFDVLAAVAALLVLAPLLAALALVVRLAIGAPIIFKQQRPGLHGRPFMICKFRTMSDAQDATGRFLSDAERLGWFGRFLRSTSLDELPELINVLRGEMSIVGPRPLMMEYL